MHITAWGTSNAFDIDEDREKRLLVHKKEIFKIESFLNEKGCSVLPLKIYFNDRGKCKVLIGLCKGKKNYDKRNDLKEKQVKRDISRALKENNR